MASKSILGMNRAIALREELAEDFWKQIKKKREETGRKVEQMREYTFTVQVMDILKADDPEGFDAWFDANVWDGDTYPEIVEKMVKRILWLEGEKCKARMHEFIMTVTPAFFEKRAGTGQG